MHLCAECRRYKPSGMCICSVVKNSLLPTSPCELFDLFKAVQFARLRMNESWYFSLWFVQPGKL